MLFFIVVDIDPTSPTLPNSLYGAPRSNNSASSISSSPPSSAGLVVPQPLSSGPGNGKGPTTNGGTGRKYQCKMCPQVGVSEQNSFFLFYFYLSFLLSLEFCYFISLQSKLKLLNLRPWFLISIHEITKWLQSHFTFHINLTQ